MRFVFASRRRRVAERNGHSARTRVSYRIRVREFPSGVIKRHGVVIDDNVGQTRRRAAAGTRSRVGAAPRIRRRRCEEGCNPISWRRQRRRRRRRRARVCDTSCIITTRQAHQKLRACLLHEQVDIIHVHVRRRVGRAHVGARARRSTRPCLPVHHHRGDEHEKHGKPTCSKTTRRRRRRSRARHRKSVDKCGCASSA